MHYQRYTLDFYLLACLTARQIQDGEAGTRFAAAATRLAEFTQTMADDGGRLPLIGDDDGGMLWPMTGRAYDDVRDSLGLAALTLGRPDLARWGACEEVFWLVGPDAVAGTPALLDVPRAEALPSKTLAQTGYVVLRDERGGHAVFDTGRHGYLNAGHAHADALSLTLALDGRSLLIDPGTLTYTMDPRLRDHLRSTASHNTITIDGQPQSVPSGPFHWRTRADAALQASRHNPGFDWAEGSHDGYAPLTHRRAVMRTDAGWLVVDDISGLGHHTVDACWHFDPQWMVACDAPGRLRATHLDQGAAWLLLDGGSVALMMGDEQTGLGWCAPVYGTLVPTWTARIRRDGVLPRTMVTWIGAAGDEEQQPPRLERFEPACDDAARAIGVRIHANDRISTFALMMGEPAAREGRALGTADFQTDARVIHYTEQAGRLIALDLVDATHALVLRDGWIDQPTSFSTTPSQVIALARSNPASPILAASFLSPNR